MNPKEINFANLFLRHAQNKTNNLAVEDGVTSLNYSQLDMASDLFANYLIAANISKGDYVVLNSTKEVATIVAIFGILKAGAIYVPVDVDSPQERLNFILEETSPSLFISEKKVAPIQTLSLEIVNTCIEKAKKAITEVQKPKITIFPEDCCYVIYTSGSTGRPKGVPITHANIAAFMEGMESIFVMDHNAKCMNTLPYHFDGSIVDTFFPLYMGASVYITPGLTIPNLLIQVIIDKKITHFTASASILTLITQIAKAQKQVDFSNLEYIMTGADVCDKEVMNFFIEENPKIKIINGYGPTEATCDALTYTITKTSSTPGYFPIGKPMKHIKAKLLTTSGTLENKPGTQGQLLLSGKQLFKGYLKRPEETQKLLKNIAGETYYYTGDICKIDAHGDFCFVGRADEEVKLNGYRIHLNEIKSVMNQIGPVKGSEVVVINGDNAKFLAIAYEKEARWETDYNTLIQILRKSLPQYMLPKIFVEFDKFPMLSTSKVDKKQIRTQLSEQLKNKTQSFYKFKNNKLLEVVPQ